MDLTPSTENLYTALEFTHPQQEKLYQKEREEVNKIFPDEGWRIPKAYTYEIEYLEYKKLQKIRSELINNEEFNDLLIELNNVKANITKKQRELDTLIPPNKPDWRQKIYTQFSGKTNSADNNINKFNETTKNIKNEISYLKKIVMNIEKLIEPKKPENPNANQERFI